MVCHNLTCNYGVFLTSTCFLDGPQFPGLFRTFNGPPLSMEAYCFRDLLLFIQFTPVLWTFYNPLLFKKAYCLPDFLCCFCVGNLGRLAHIFSCRRRTHSPTSLKVGKFMWGAPLGASNMCVYPKMKLTPDPKNARQILVIMQNSFFTWLYFI